MATWGDNQTWIESLDIILSVSFSPSKISFSSSPNSYQVLSAGTLVLGYWSMRENCAPELANSIGKGYFCIIKNHHSTDQLDYHKCIFTYYSCLPSQKAWWPGPGSNIALLADYVTSVYLGRSVYCRPLHHLKNIAIDYEYILRRKFPRKSTQYSRQYECHSTLLANLGDTGQAYRSEMISPAVFVSAVGLLSMVRVLPAGAPLASCGAIAPDPSANAHQAVSRTLANSPFTLNITQLFQGYTGGTKYNCNFY